MKKQHKWLVGGIVIGIVATYAGWVSKIRSKF